MTYESIITIFKQEIIEVCKRHGFSISHEDEHGAFIIKKHNENLTDWFMEAEYEED